METRPYTEKEDAAWVFSDLLKVVARRGWFSAGPSAEDGKSLLYVSFHVHPDDADDLFALIKKGIVAYGGRTKWVLEREQNNRFLLCPVEVGLRARKLNNVGGATDEVRHEMPELEHEAALDLILLSDFLYEVSRSANS